MDPPGILHIIFLTPENISFVVLPLFPSSFSFLGSFSLLLLPSDPVVDRFTFLIFYPVKLRRKVLAFHFIEHPVRPAFKDDLTDIRHGEIFNKGFVSRNRLDNTGCIVFRNMDRRTVQIISL